MMGVTFDFTGKSVVVCGGSRGIGRAIAEAFAVAGAKVSLCARGAEGVAAAVTALEAHGGVVHGAACDLADAAAIEGYIAEAAQALGGGIDVLVNNASALSGGVTDAAWEAAFTVDILGTVRATRAAVPLMAGREGANIVNLSSISAYMPSAATPSYAAIKAALSHYTMSEALALAPQRIRVNALAPGSILFPGGSWERRRTEQPEVFNRVLGKIPFGRYGTPEEMASATLFLASPAASWITGHTLVADGGQMLPR